MGHVCQVKGTQKLADIRGLTTSHPALGWPSWWRWRPSPLPPAGVFMSEFLLVTSAFAKMLLLALLLVAGLLVAFGALMLKLSDIAFGAPAVSPAPRR